MVEISLSDCLSDRLQSFYFIILINFFFNRLLCRIGIALFDKESNLIYIGILYLFHSFV